MNQFLSCDWGTSSFRLRLVDAEKNKVIASVDSDKGILPSFHLWKATGNGQAEARISFYLQIIDQHVRMIEKDIHASLEGSTVVVSGMASSSLGIVQLPYGEIPFNVDGSGLYTEFLAADPTFKYRVLLVSGIKSGDDVMRGEETQLVGCFNHESDHEGNELYLFPGTHSKHILVRDLKAVAFTTFMTGEFFAILSTKSILQDAVEKTPGGVPDLIYLGSFIQGVKAGAGSTLLDTCFKVRTNDLFHKLNKQENFNYLSGLLIGSELHAIVALDQAKIYLCSGSHLKVYYETAMQTLGFGNRVHTFPAEWVDEAVIRGHVNILKKVNQ